MSRQRTCVFPAWTVTKHMTLNIPKVCLTFLFRDILRDPGNLMRNMIGSGFLGLKPRLARRRVEIKMRKMSLFTQLQNGTKSFSPRGALLILPPRGSLVVPSQSEGTKTPLPFTLTVETWNSCLFRTSFSEVLWGYIRQCPGEGRGVSSAVLFLQLPCSVSKLTVSQVVQSRPLSEEGTELFWQESK